MATLSDAEQHLYDLGVNGKGYQIAWSVATEQYFSGATSAYQKIGRDLLVEKSDQNVEEITENKMDGLHWSSQRSWWNGGKQKRLDSPFSDPEKFLRAKNMFINDRGELTMSRSIEENQASTTHSITTFHGGVTSSGSTLMWLAPSGTDWVVRQKSDLDGSVTDATVGTNDVFAITNDSSKVYVTENNQILRGDIGSSSALSTWNSDGDLYWIGNVKERILGLSFAGSSPTKVVEFDDSTGASTIIKEFGPGYGFASGETGHNKHFAEVHGFAAWLMHHEPDGELWLWDGTTTKKAAVFQGILADQVVSFGEQFLIIIGRDAFPDAAGEERTHYIIEAAIDGNGVANWDIMHTWKTPRVGSGNANATLTQGGNEVFFLCDAHPDELEGLTDDGERSGTRAEAIGSYNVATKSINLLRFHGAVSGSSTTNIYASGDRPSLGYFQGRVVLGKKDGTLMAETEDEYPFQAELLSSRIDFNIDAEKSFLMGELGLEPLPANTTAKLEYTPDDPGSSPTYTEVGSASLNDTLVRERLGSNDNGELERFMHYRIRLESSDNVSTPNISKAGLGAVYAKKPVYDHILVLQAYDHMSLRNGNTWPGDRGPDTLQSELETLRDNQTVIDFQEPLSGGAARSSVKAQVRAVEAVKRFQSQEGWKNLLRVQIRETPN